MTRELPDGFTARHPAPDDAPGILAVGIARDIEDLGEPDYSLDDVREELEEAGPAAYVVLDDGGTVVASGLLTGADVRVAVHPNSCKEGIGTWLREQLEQRARGPLVRQQVAGSNDAARRLLKAAGYDVTQRFWRMVRDLEDLPQPQWPDGVAPRPYESDDAQAAYALISDAFRDIPGNVERSFDEWRAQSVQGGQFAPELSTIAPGQGVAICERWEDGQGYVAYLAVAREQRGKGLGRALLAESLNKMHRAGLTKAALGVNGSNESATRLYRSVGMASAFEAERYEKKLA